MKDMSLIIWTKNTLKYAKTLSTGLNFHLLPKYNPKYTFKFSQGKIIKALAEFELHIDFMVYIFL